MAVVALYGFLVLVRAAELLHPAAQDFFRRMDMSSAGSQQNQAPVVAHATAAATADNDWASTVQIEVKADPGGLWTVAREFISGPARIRFEAKGSWNYVPESACGPDGDMLSMLSSEQAILKGAPVGSLIAKIGGSSAGQNDGTVYLIGSFAVIEIDQNVKGPLYLTINDDPTGFANNRGTIEVDVRWKPISPPATPAKKDAS